MPLARRAFLQCFRWLLNLYFRDIEVTGPLPPKAMTGRLLVANHVNGLVDPALVLTRLSAPVSPVGKATLWKIPGLRPLLDVSGAVPIVRKQDAPTKSASDNDAVFARVSQHLNNGGNILIFPEGISHNEPHVVKLKSGAARMLALAHNQGARGLTFQAVGLEFDARDTFRSRALCNFGPVRDVDSYAASAIMADGTTAASDALANAIVAQMAADLGALVAEGDDWEELRLIHLAADMFATEEGAGSMDEHSAFARRVEAAKTVFKGAGSSEFEAARAALLRYNENLLAARTSDRAVAYASRGSGPSTSTLRALLTPFALLGCLLYWVPYQIPRLVARTASGDVVSTYKLGAGLLAFPIWTLLLSIVASVFAYDIWGAIAGMLTVVASAFAALYWLDGRDRSIEARPPESTRVLLDLQAERGRVLAMLIALRDRLELTELPDSLLTEIVG
jgi:glycerol-3-phosphate O-acyltransferase / dihydroxyacetone phosphate acyltransferase